MSKVNKMESGSAGVIHLLDGVDRDDINALLETDHKVFSRLESIFDTGDKADAMYVVLDSEAQVDVGGRFHRLTRGTVLGEMRSSPPAGGWPRGSGPPNRCTSWRSKPTTSGPSC
jgi:hypothetical protein